jgi:hypothetical protein
MPLTTETKITGAQGNKYSSKTAVTQKGAMIGRNIRQSKNSKVSRISGNARKRAGTEEAQRTAQKSGNQFMTKPEVTLYL